MQILRNHHAVQVAFFKVPTIVLNTQCAVVLNNLIKKGQVVSHGIRVVYQTMCGFSTFVGIP